MPLLLSLVLTRMLWAESLSPLLSVRLFGWSQNISDDP